MKDVDEIYEKKKLSEEERNKAIKEASIFALVAFLLYTFQLILPPILRVCVHFTNLILK